MSTTNTPQPSEEVDLGQLFKMIGNAFQRLFQFIGSIFNTLFLAFVWFVFFIRKRAVVLLIAAVAGLSLGLILDKTSPPTYKSSITVKQNYATGENLYGSVDYYNSLLNDGDYEVLGRILGLKKNISEDIIGIEIEPIITDNDRVVMFDKYISGLDSLAVSKVEYEVFVENIKKYKHQLQQISIKSKTRANFKNLFDNIIGDINTNTFFVNEQAKDLAELNQQKEALEQSLAQSDSLQRTYKRVLEQQMESKSTSETSITFEGNNDKNKTREFDLYKSDIELRREIVQIERKLKDKQNIVEIISGKQDSGFVDDTNELLELKLDKKHYYLVVFTILSLVILLGIEFLKFIEKYKPE